MSYCNSTLIDDEFLYILQDKSDDHEPGFYLQNLMQIRNKDDDSKKVEFSFKLKNAIGGRSNMLAFFGDEERIGY